MADTILYVSLAIVIIGLIILINKREVQEAYNTESRMASKTIKKPTTKKQVEKTSLGTYYVPHTKIYEEKIHVNDKVTAWTKTDSNEVRFYHGNNREAVGIMNSRKLANLVENYKIEGAIVQIEPKELTIRLYYR